ncbi:type II toxin-antitoxin system VapB family antitoxin [Kitasatospora sp. LaBMicrA B282]|uniref:type II toxin-antitoxin system VapB family antitoxin n=1 Tax=Kitasatospora sp. LaBMicrA B282 TaxID=3420949 RepID=UPI003D0972C0
MTRTGIDLDEDLLEEAQRLFGTTTKVAAVNAALLEAVKLARRMELADAIANGEFDLLGESVDEGGVLRGARTVAEADRLQHLLRGCD